MKNLSQDIFDIKRFLWIVYLEVRKEFKAVLITLGAVLGIFLLFSFFYGYTRRPESYLQNFMAIFLVGGIIRTSQAFRDYYRRERNTPLLMLPASKTEKWLEKLFLTTIGWGAGSFLLYNFYVLISAGLNEFFFGFHTSPFWWDGSLIGLFLHYLVIHSVFFLGSAVYKKNSLFKTVLTVFFLIVAATAVTVFFAWIFLSDLYSAGIGLSNQGIHIGPSDLTPEVEGFFVTLGKVMKAVYWAAVIPYCWAVSFIRFTEIEVKDGV